VFARFFVPLAETALGSEARVRNMEEIKKKYGSDGFPIGEAFDSEEEAQEAYKKYLEEIDVELEDKKAFRIKWLKALVAAQEAGEAK
jgi:hypothetical protein